MEQELSYQMPRIGDQAPDFNAVTTIGNLKLSDYNKDPGLYNRNEWLCARQRIF
jgi:hypothetical protein